MMTAVAGDQVHVVAQQRDQAELRLGGLVRRG